MYIYNIDKYSNYEHIPIKKLDMKYTILNEQKY